MNDSQRTQVASALAARLHGAEAAVEEAIAQVAGLVAYMPQARADAGLSPTAAQGAIDHSVASLTRLTLAMGDLAKGHRVLEALAVRLGIDTTDFGPLVKPDAIPLSGSGDGGTDGGLSADLPGIAFAKAA